LAKQVFLEKSVKANNLLAAIGIRVGVLVGAPVAVTVVGVSDTEGCTVGTADGLWVGTALGARVGLTVGLDVGAIVNT